MSGALSSPFNEVPCTQAAPPAAIDVLPASATSLLVAFPPSEDDGGKPITNYKVEWDAIGLEGYRNGGSPLDSLLYSDVDVQAVEVSASKNDVGGSFFLAYRSAKYVARPRVCWLVLGRARNKTSQLRLLLLPLAPRKIKWYRHPRHTARTE